MAGGLQEEESEDLIASINMIPFIDISLVLLIIFLVTSSIIVQQAIEVNLPRAASGAESAPSTVGITVTRDGNVYFNGEPTTMSALASQMRREADADASVRAVISADREVDYGVIIDVIDVVKQNGASAFALNVEAKPAPRADEEVTP